MREKLQRAADPIASYLTPGLLFAAALIVRALPLPTVITAKFGVQPFGNDAFYHLRRIEFAVANPGEFLGFDRYLNFPHGASPIWSPAFDWLLALLVRATTPAGNSQAMESLLVWVPPVLGALTVVVVYFIALRFFSFGVALGAGALLGILPSHFWYSQIGFIDHHVAVALLAALLLAAGMSLVSVEVEDTSPSASALRRASALGLAMGTAVLFWPGALLHVGSVQLLLGVRVLLSSSRAEAVAWARLLAFVHTIAFFVVVPFFGGNQWELWGDFSPVVGSNFQPMWFALGALAFAGLSELWRRGDDADTQLDRALAALALAAIVVGVSVWVIPELSRGLLQSWGWFSKDEAFQASVAESAPLFRAPAKRVRELFGFFVYGTPLMFALLVWDRRRNASAAFWFLLGFAAVLCAATLMQRRFMNSAAIPYALVTVLALGVCFRFAARLSKLAVLALAVLTFVGLWPSLASYGVDLANVQAARAGRDPHLLHAKRVLLLKSSAARGIRRLTPETTGYLKAGVKPEYSVLTPWADGHVVKYRGHRPVNVDNFGNDVGEENFISSEQYFQTDREPEAVEILKKLGAKYVLASAVEVRRVGGYGLRSMFARLSLPKRGPTRTIGKGKKERSVQVLRLSHHRLIFETVPFDGAPGTERSYFKLYEVVEGARIAGSAPPGTLVEARLLLSPRMGGEVLFATGAKVGKSGRYTLTVPYPNEDFSEAVKGEDSYAIHSRGGSVNVRITEAQVQSGATIEAPPLP